MNTETQTQQEQNIQDLNAQLRMEVKMYRERVISNCRKLAKSLTFAADDLEKHPEGLAVGFAGIDVVRMANSIKTDCELFNTLLRYQYAAKELEKK